MDALVVHLTSKGRREDCQAKSDGSARFSRREQHIFWRDTSATAMVGVKIPVRRAKVILGRKAECLCGAVDGLRLAFQLEKRANRCFIEVQMQAPAQETCSEFFVPEASPQSESRQVARETGRRCQNDFTLGTSLVPRGFMARRLCFGRGSAFGSQNRFGPSARDPLFRSRFFDPYANQAAAAPEIGMGRVEQGVLLQNPPPRNCAHPIQSRKYGR
jgi:hypothetical protein